VVLCFRPTPVRIDSLEVSQSLPNIGKLLAAIRKAASIVESSKTNFDKDQLACIRRWRAGAIPRQKALKALLPLILKLETEGKQTRPPDDLEPAFGEFMPKEPGAQNAGGKSGNKAMAEEVGVPEAKSDAEAQPAAPWTRAEFAKWFVASFDAVRLQQLQEKRRLRDARKKHRTLILNRRQDKLELASASPEVIRAVDNLIVEAGIPVVEGCAVLRPDTILNLAPLYEYVNRLQETARIPSYFPGVPDIVLDKLYVDIAAAPDQRGGGSSNSNEISWEAADIGALDPMRIWRERCQHTCLRVERLITAAATKPVVVLGDPGSGKSTLARYLTSSISQELVNGGEASKGTLAFRIEGRHLRQRLGNSKNRISHYLVDHILKVSLQHAEEWTQLLDVCGRSRPGRILIVVDGIDEMYLSDDERSELSNSWETLGKSSSIVFTSRRAGFRSPILDFHTFEIVPLSDNSIRSLIAHWFQSVHPRTPSFASSLQRWVFSDSNRHDLATSPCLLALMCYLNQQRTEAEFIDVRSRAQLYDSAVQSIIEKQGNQIQADSSDAFTLLAEFALSRYSAQGLRARPNVLFTQAHVRGFLARTDCKRRWPLASPERAISAWQSLGLVSKWDLGKWHCFIHLSFQEFSAAWAMMGVERHAVDALARNYGYDPYWRELWMFYAGLCDLVGNDGVERFRGLVVALVPESDLGGELEFLVAPIIGQYGASDTTDILGYDIRVPMLKKICELERAEIDWLDKLPDGAQRLDSLESHWNILRNHPVLIPKVRALLDLDSTYCLSWARFRIDSLFRRDGWGERVSGEVWHEAMISVVVINMSYHPDAIEYQKALIVEEARLSNAVQLPVPMGPQFTSARNQEFSEVIAGVDFAVVPSFQLIRLVRYMGFVCDERVVARLIELAERADLNSEEGVAVARECFVALCRCRCSGAVAVFRRLWMLGLLEMKYLPGLIERLASLDSEDAAELLEEMVEDERVENSSDVSHAVLTGLARWVKRPVPVRVMLKLKAGNLDVSSEKRLWQSVLDKLPLNGREELRSRMEHIRGECRAGANDYYRLASLLGLFANAFPEQREYVLEVASDFPERPECLEYVLYRPWPVVFEAFLRSGFDARAQEWIMGPGLQKFKQTFLSSRESIGSGVGFLIARLRSVSVSCANVYVHALLEAIEGGNIGIYPWALFGIEEYGHLVPVDVSRMMFDSGDKDAQDVSFMLLIDSDPQYLVQHFNEGRVKEFIKRWSAARGIVVFNDRMYDPKKRAWTHWGLQ
jgi:hypothetical protein